MLVFTKGKKGKMLVFTKGKKKEKCQFLLYVGRCKGKTDICQVFFLFFSMNLSLTRHPCFPVPLFSSTCLTSTLDPSAAHSFPHLFPSDCFCSLIFSSLPYGLCPPPPFLPPPTLPRYQVSQGNLISFKLLEVCWTFMSTFSI